MTKMPETMKKTFTAYGPKAVIAIVAALLSLSACTKESIPDPASGSPETPVHPSGYVCFTAGAPEAEADAAAVTAQDTRAGYDSGTGHAVWEEGDRLGVSVYNMYGNYNTPFTQKPGSLSEDRRTAEFEGTFYEPVTGTKTFYAVYPHTQLAYLTSTIIKNTTFPGRQVYTPGGYTGIPLFGKYVGPVDNLTFGKFMNPFAIVELRLTSAEKVRVKEIIFRGNNDEPAAGTIDVDMSGERPAISFVSTPSKSITLDCGEGVALSQTPTSFYIAIPVQEYAKEYRFDIRTDRADAKDVVLFAKGGGVTPLANTIVRTPVKTLTATDYKRIIPDKAFRDALATSDYVQVTNETTGEVDILKTDGTMSVSNKSIASLAGIEYFPEITTLNCTINQLTKLDVTKNTALIQLDCYFNRLSALEVSQNPELMYLACNNNELTALDVSQMPKLWILQCGSNRLTELIVSQNTKLTTLECNSNWLTALDVSQNQELVNLVCDNNELKALVLSNDSSLQKLHCYTNQLTELDVSANPKLTELQCQKNRLSVLDATTMANPTGYTLYCGRQKDAEGTAVTLQLTLKKTQQSRWETSMANDSSNKDTVAAFVD